MNVYKSVSYAITVQSAIPSVISYKAIILHGVQSERLKEASIKPKGEIEGKHSGRLRGNKESSHRSSN